MPLLKALGSSVSPYYTLAGALFIGLVLLSWRRTRRVGQLWIALVLATYVLLSLPVVANGIAGSLPAARVTAPARPVRVLVLFDGDNRRGRLRAALNVVRTDGPGMVWVLGDSEGWFLDELQAEGVERDRVSHDLGPANTREQMTWVARFAADHPTTSLAIVASRLQTPRMVALGRAIRLDLRLVVSPIDDEPPTSGWRLWTPAYIALRTSRDAIYEHLALWYYGWKGWID